MIYFNYICLNPKGIFFLLICNKIITKMKEIKRKIRSKGLKISWVASQLNISQPALSMYLNEKRDMPYDVEVRIKNLLK